MLYARITEEEMENIKVLGQLQADQFNDTGEDTSEYVGFESEETGQWVINPFVDESMMIEVDPLTYYGVSFFESDFNDAKLVASRITLLTGGE